jgi:hypothetical protein
MKPRIDGYIDDVLIPPPSSERWATIANNLDLNIFAPPVDKAIASEYRRDMGVHAYKTRAIFELLDQCDPRAVDMSWTLAWQVSHANLPQSVEYAQDWLHVEIQQDLARPCLSICNTASSSLVQEEYEIRK